MPLAKSMNIINLWRQEILALLPCGFLKISREQGFLFVSDFPLRIQDALYVQARLENAGFVVQLPKGMAFMDAGAEKYARAAAMLPLYVPKERAENRRLLFLARLLMAGEEGYALARFVLRCTALHDEKALERLPGLIALAKRKKQPLSPLAGKILLQYLMEKEEPPC
ncbi:MAG: hypothetical protein IJN44_06785 [Clostridia bacterium]|nr:hypothetical protein [Clostridia bacterium]